MPPSLPLPAAPVLTAGDLARGERAVVTAVEAPPCDVERMAALGLVPGATLSVLRAGATLRLAVGEMRLALGRTWARAIAVVRC